MNLPPPLYDTAIRTRAKKIHEATKSVRNEELGHPAQNLKKENPDIAGYITDDSLLDVTVSIDGT